MDPMTPIFLAICLRVYQYLLWIPNVSLLRNCSQVSQNECMYIHFLGLGHLFFSALLSKTVGAQKCSCMEF